MKKLVTILLALAMILCLSATVFAADEDTTTLTVTPNSDGILRTYMGYQLLELNSMSLKAEGHTCENGNHNETCYNYSYTVIEQYKEILQHEVFVYAGTNFWGNTEKPPVDQIEDDQIVKYLSELSSDNNDGFGTLRKAADRIYRAIQAAQEAGDNIVAEQDEFTTTTAIEKGYWLFVDVTDLDGNEMQTNSLVIVDTLAKDNITITPKTALPTLTKKVQEIDDSENESIANMPWQDYADHDIGDNVPFKLTATLPSNVQYYSHYTLIFHDTLSDALVLSNTNRFNKDLPEQDRLAYKVFMYNDLGTANIDNDLNAGEDVTEYFTMLPQDVNEECTFKIGGDIYALPEALKTRITANTVFVVYYEAVLQDNAKLGNPGNPNTAYLEFSNDPYNTDSTGVTEEDEALVFTYSITVNKVNEQGAALEGAGFILYKKDFAGNFNPIAVGQDAQGNPIYELTGVTSFTWVGLDEGDYLLREETVPAGFNGMADREFAIASQHTETPEGLKLTSLTTTSYTGDVDTGNVSFAVVNRTGAALPETGAEGTFLLISGGALLVVMAAIFMITRKKMSIYED